MKRNDVWLYSGLGVYLFLTVYGVWAAEIATLERLVFIIIAAAVVGILLALAAMPAFGFSPQAVLIVAVVLLLLAAASFAVIFWIASKIP
jgi:hypothetical protein